MMEILIAILLCIATQPTDGSSINRNASHLVEDIELFRKTLVGLHDDFFDVEVAVNGLDIENAQNGTLTEEFTEFRKELTGLPDQLFDMELQLNSFFAKIAKDDGDSDDDSDDDSDGDSDDDSDDNCDTWSTWNLAMNLNPADGHIMDYTTGWASETSIGTDGEALRKDYKNQTIWNQPADYISIVRHQNRTIEAVKVFKFIQGGISLYKVFNSSNDPAYYRKIMTSGGPIQESIAPDAPYLSDDPIFSIAGDLCFNWGYFSDGTRIALSGGHLSSETDTTDKQNTHGLGNHFYCDPKTGISIDDFAKHEIANILDCPCCDCTYQLQGTDHGSYSYYRSGPVYGNYAIYVSKDATSFPDPGYQLDLEIKQCDTGTM